MTEHPHYRMWRDRLDREEAAEQARAERRAAQEQERAEWYLAWERYKSRRSFMGSGQPLPRWWNIPGWVRWLLRLHAPGRHG